MHFLTKGFHLGKHDFDMWMYKHSTEIKWVIDIQQKVNVFAARILQVVIFNINEFVLLGDVLQMIWVIYIWSSRK